MSEIPSGGRPNWAARDEQTRARREALQPNLGELVAQAKAAYKVLRPRARHVSTVERDFPLRHQQVHGWGGNGPGGVVADYLMVAFGSNHDLVLHCTLVPNNSYTWQFTRSKPVSDTHYEQTTVEKYPSADRLGFDTSLVVARYRYGNPKGTNDAHEAFVCSHFNDYANAEQYIEGFEDDIADALLRFGPATSPGTTDPAAS